MLTDHKVRFQFSTDTRFIAQELLPHMLPFPQVARVRDKLEKILKRNITGWRR